jgi:zinc transport system ATP-binding protein
MPVPAVELRGVTLRLNGHLVLDRITLTVQEGEFWGIIGPNGGGKTTLLRTILGILKPQEGVVKVLGVSPKEAVKRGWLGYLPQRTTGRSFPVSALEVVMLGECNSRNFFKPFKEKEREAALKALSLVGLEHKAQEPFPHLSGGEQQRVLVAMALVSRPRILLLDEPNTGVDVVAQEGLYQVLKRLKEELSITILMVTHDVGVVSHFVDRIACLNTTLHFSGDPWGAMDCHLLEKLYGEPVEIFVHHPECQGCHVLRSRLHGRD